MSTATMTAQGKRNKSYPPPDTSKVYESVPRSEKPKMNFIRRTLSRIDAELCLIALEDREKIAMLVIFLVLFFVFVFNPLSLVKKLL